MDMKCLKPICRDKSGKAFDVVYTGDYPRVIVRRIPAELLPHTCKLCGDDLPDWRVALGFDEMCGGCYHTIGELQAETKPIATHAEPSAILQLLGAWKAGEDAKAADDGRAMVRKCRYAVERIAARAGADMSSPVTRQSILEATADCVASLLGKLAKAKADNVPSVNVWKRIWFSARDTIRRQFVISNDSASFGALVLRPMLPSGYVAPSDETFIESVELREQLRNELRGIFARLGANIDDFELCEAVEVIREALPETFAAIATKYCGRQAALMV